MDTLLLTFRQALRGLLKTPGFLATAVLTLALGIGANSAMFSAIHAVFLKPLPFPHEARLVAVDETTPSRGEHRGRFSEPDFHDFRAQATCFEAMGIYRSATLDLTGAGLPERLRGRR